MEVILEKLGKIGFDWKMAAFNLVNFLVLFWILKKFFFQSVQDTISERQEKIQEGIENAKKAETELQMAERKAQEIVDEAKVEANKIRKSAKEEADEITENMKEEAKEEIEGLISRAKGNIAKEREKMREELKDETVALAMAATEKILNKQLNQEEDERFIKNILSSVQND